MRTILDRIGEEYAKNDVVILTASNLSPDVPDLADLVTRQVVFNLNSDLVNQVPFRMAHELMHIIHADETSRRMVAYHNYDVANPEERKANNAAIKFLISIYLENNDEFNWLHFMETFGVPGYLECRVIEIAGELV